MFNKIKEYFITSSDILEVNNLKLLVAKIGLIILALFAPIIQIILGVFFLIGVDLITGVIAAKRNCQKITSSKLSRTISKILVYVSTIIIVHIVQISLLFDGSVPLENLVSSYIALTELKSILENLDKMTKGQHGVLSNLVHLLSNDGRKTAQRRKQRSPRKSVSNKTKK